MSFSILFPTNEFAAGSKSPEQIQLLTLPPCLPIDQILTHIATKGLPPQYPYLYRHLAESHKNVLPFVCAQAPSQQGENQILIASTFKRLLLQKANLLTSSQKQLIFQSCLECLNNLQSPANDELISTIELVLKVHQDRIKLLRRLETVALDLGKPHQPSISKVTAGRLVTILGSYSGRALKNQLFDILKRVLVDSEAEARKIGLSELFPKLLQVLDLQFVQLHFQERIYEAVWDENEEIGVLALEVILRNASKFSPLEQSSRIVKLFVDSLTSKSEKVAIMATSLMGQAYQKLQHVILRSQTHCLRFWKSLVQLSQSKNQKILNNMIYNIPGILILAAPYHRVDPLCDIYCELYYNPKTNKLLLSGYLHEMVKLFPSKWTELKDLVYWMLSELLDDDAACDDAVKITSKIMSQLGQIKGIFLVEAAPAEGRGEKPQKQFEQSFCNHLVKYIDLLVNKKVSAWLVTLFLALRQTTSCFNSEFVEQTLLPKLYTCLKTKIAGVETIVQIVVMLLSRQGNPILTNIYFSKFSTELMKSSRSYQREIALSFFYYCSIYFSIQTFQQFKLGQKYLSFNNDKNLKIRAFYICNLPRVWYYLIKEEKIQYSIIVNRLKKDQDPQIHQIVSSVQFAEDGSFKEVIAEKSKQMKQYERQRLTFLNIRKQQQSLSRRPVKQLRKEDVLRKRVESTRGKNKIVIKQVPKRKMTPMMVKANSNVNLARNS